MRTIPIAYRLIEEGRRHLLLRRPDRDSLPDPPAGTANSDPDVPWMTASRIAEQVLSGDVRVFLVPDGDHRLAREQDLARIWASVDELCTSAES